MDKFEKYHFDLTGYLIVKNILTVDEVTKLKKAANELEEHVIANMGKPPFKKNPFGPSYRYDKEQGYHVLGTNNKNDNFVVDDFYNAGADFDFIIGHEKTMAYVRSVVQGNITLNNAELRVRYPGNKTFAHMGGPMTKRFSYRFSRGPLQDALVLAENAEIDCSMIRILYALHDISNENGPLCVVPGSHKANYFSPYDHFYPEKEPGMIGLELKAGDAILFTENLRHGGYPNLSAITRKTIHLGYGPNWLKSQNMATHDEEPFILDKTYKRYTEQQKQLFSGYYDSDTLFFNNARYGYFEEQDPVKNAHVPQAGIKNKIKHALKNGPLAYFKMKVD